jgi:hypothetical protein
LSPSREWIPLKGAEKARVDPKLAVVDEMKGGRDLADPTDVRQGRAGRVVAGPSAFDLEEGEVHGGQLD